MSLVRDARIGITVGAALTSLVAVGVLSAAATRWPIRLIHRPLSRAGGVLKAIASARLTWRKTDRRHDVDLGEDARPREAPNGTAPALERRRHTIVVSRFGNERVVLPSGAVVLRDDDLE